MRQIAMLLVVATLAIAGCGKKEQNTAEQAPPAPAPSTEQATAPTPSAPATVAARPPFVSNDPKLQHGYEVFQKWCAPCHAPGPGHPGTQALDAKYKGAQPGPLEDRTDLTPDLTKTFVRGGVSIMPPFRKTEITDAELDDLAAYIARPR